MEPIIQKLMANEYTLGPSGDGIAHGNLRIQTLMGQVSVFYSIVVI